MPSASFESMDRRVKWGLLSISLITAALVVYSFLMECAWPTWRKLRLEYETVLKAKATDERGRLLLEQFEVNIQQTVLPKLGVIDRCVTCHPGTDDPRMVNEKQPFRTHPGNVLSIHSADTFGCTVCHAGQGLATEKADAHGTAPFWPTPMIPARYAFAGCGTCHTHVRVPNQLALKRGQACFEKLNCLTCHKLDGRGGAKSAGGVEGPDLSCVGASGSETAWYEKHLQKSQEAAGGAWKTSFTSIDEESQKDLGVFLSSRVGAPGLVEAKSMFLSLGCRGCHKVNGVGGDDGPDLSLAGERDPGHTDFTHVPGEHTVANWYAEHLRDPAKIVPGSKMPKLGLTEEQIDRLVFYLLSLRHNTFAEAFWPKDRIRAERFGEREFTTDGETLYGTFCAACHGAKGEGMHYPGMPVFPAIASPDFLAVASDEFIAAAVNKGRPGRRMPAWGKKDCGLRAEEVKSVTAYLRKLGGVPAPEPDSKPARWAKGDVAKGKLLYAAYCAGCHGTEGQGVEGPALNNKILLSSATDTYLFESIARSRRGSSMDGFSKASTVHPALSQNEIEAIVSLIRTWEK